MRNFQNSYNLIKYLFFLLLPLDARPERAFRLFFCEISEVMFVSRLIISPFNENNMLVILLAIKVKVN